MGEREDGSESWRTAGEIDFERWSAEAARWSAGYVSGLAQRPVRPDLDPGTVLRRLAASAPETGEGMEAIFADFRAIVPDAMTHWQHPRFFAYFQSNAAPAAIVAEQLAAAMAAQCMLWQTAPAATEMETRMVSWLGQAVGLPMQDAGAADGFAGTMQDTASSATLAAVLTMRELATDRRGNRHGLSGEPRLRVYASGRTHSSVAKALWIAGLGDENLVRIPTGEGPLFAMDTAALREAVAADRRAGHVPAGIVACVGGTSIGATDAIAATVGVAREEGLYLHVDAAWAGSAMVCEEFRPLWAGIEGADSIVFNPHKWLGTGMECSCHLVREPQKLVDTLAIRPSYLATLGAEGRVDYSEWSITLGRRFRALKVWFLLRAYGLDGLRRRIRDHVRWSHALCERLRGTEGFEIVTEPVLSLFSFRHRDWEAPALAEAINRDGRIYLTAGDHDGTPMIRFVAGQFGTREEDMEIAFQAITEVAASR